MTKDTDTDTANDNGVDPNFEHEVTYPNTRKHWVMYSLDAYEAESQQRDEDGQFTQNRARTVGVRPKELFEFVGGADSIVFKNKTEVSQLLAELARSAPYFKLEERPVNRRTNSTEWSGPDSRFQYRLTEFGRNVLLDLGSPDKLPNRNDFEEDDRALGVKPAHEPGWWREEYDLYDSEWNIHDNEWVSTKYDRVFYKHEKGKMFEERGYLAIGRRLAEEFEDVTFVLTVGPYRSHDLMYAIRDPFNRVVQIDIYSPMAMHRTNDEIRENFESLVRDLRRGLQSVNQDDGST